jgi:hypothetical protein
LRYWTLLVLLKFHSLKLLVKLYSTFDINPSDLILLCGAQGIAAVDEIIEE